MRKTSPCQSECLVVVDNVFGAEFGGDLELVVGGGCGEHDSSRGNSELECEPKVVKSNEIDSILERLLWTYIETPPVPNTRTWSPPLIG